MIELKFFFPSDEGGAFGAFSLSTRCTNTSIGKCSKYFKLCVKFVALNVETTSSNKENAQKAPTTGNIRGPKQCASGKIFLLKKYLF